MNMLEPILTRLGPILVDEMHPEPEGYFRDDAVALSNFDWETDHPRLISYVVGWNDRFPPKIFMIVLLRTLEACYKMRPGYLGYIFPLSILEDAGEMEDLKFKLSPLKMDELRLVIKCIEWLLSDETPMTPEWYCNTDQELKCLLDNIKRQFADEL